MIFLFIPKNNGDSWFRIPKGFSITTPSNINWQHICMNILSGHPPEVPNHIVWNSHFCVYSILLPKISSRFSASQKRMGTWLCTIATLFGKDFLIFPEALKPRVGEHGQAELVLQAKTCCTLHMRQNRGLCDEFVGSFVLRKFTQDGPRHRLYIFISGVK